MKSLAALLGLFASAGALAAEPVPAPPSQPAAAQAAPAQGGGWIAPLPTPYGPVVAQQGMLPSLDYPMNRIISPEEKKRFLQIATPMMANMMQIDAREAVNYMVSKYKAKSGLSFDEVVASPTNGDI